MFTGLSDDGGGEVEIGAEAFVSFVVAGCDSSEFLDLAK
jgi:hypothetical protein